MSASFYDRLARRQGARSPPARRSTDSPIADPEEQFAQLVQRFGGQDRRALAVGCGDGQFTVRMATGYRHVVGIDASPARIAQATEWLQGHGAAHVTLLEQDARQTTFPAASFDVVYCRRGPAYFSEYARLLVPGGYFLSLTIGNRDAVELKEVFGRGQEYHSRDISRLEQDRQALQQAGFQVRYLGDYCYDDTTLPLMTSKSFCEWRTQVGGAPALLVARGTIEQAGRAGAVLYYHGFGGAKEDARECLEGHGDGRITTGSDGSKPVPLRPRPRHPRRQCG